MKPVAIFGAGKMGKIAAMSLQTAGREIVCFVDNDSKKQGQELLGIPIWSLEHFLKEKDNLDLIVACAGITQSAIQTQLKSAGILNYTSYDERDVFKKERVMSYAYKSEMEDVILYHVLKNEQDVFYIDIGCNDPVIGSVTKLLYDKLGARGINVDVDADMINLSRADRSRDICLQIAVGKEACDSMRFYAQGAIGGLNTMVASNIRDDANYSFDIKMTTLKNICQEYVQDGQKIHFLKIDVEGAEKDVLLGADFEKYRPMIVVMESTLPLTNIPNYDDWEDILIAAKYHFVYSHGINRYYVADEYKDLDSRFVPWEKLVASYCIFSVEHTYGI